jgi:hypothetical protein
VLREERDDLVCNGAFATDVGERSIHGLAGNLICTLRLDLYWYRSVWSSYGTGERRIDAITGMTMPGFAMMRGEDMAISGTFLRRSAHATSIQKGMGPFVHTKHGE